MAGARDEERIDRIRKALASVDLDGLICSLPEHVLLLSGYWPVVANAWALITRDGRVAVVAPEDESELVERGWPDERIAFRPVSTDKMTTLEQAVRGPLAEAARSLGLNAGRVGFERGPASQPAPYSAMSIYAATAVDLIGQALPSARLEPADELLRELQGRKTPHELESLRLTCRIAERAFQAGAAQLRAGQPETEVASLFRAPLSIVGTGFEGVGRADGFAWCMSGPNAAEAQAAYARSRPKPIQQGELVLIHCNSYADGFWTDITRTYSLGAPDRRQGALYDAVLSARAEALAVIKPGNKASDVDRVARAVLEERGLGSQFKHPAGHGVGFAAIDHNARPRLHPKSNDDLESGMVFNLEPAVYQTGSYGLRHCDVVAVTGTGAEVLTPFHATIDQLVAR